MEHLIDMDSNGQYKLGAWDLTALLAAPEGEPVDEVIAQLEELVTAYEDLRDKLADDLSSEDFNAALAMSETMRMAAHRLGAYASLWFSEDTQNQKSLAFQGKIDQLLTDVQNRTLFFSLWWKSLDNDVAARLIASAPEDLRYYLEHERAFKPHVLPEREEQLINIKDVNGVNGLTTVYEMLTNAYKFHLTIDGEEKELTRGELMSYAFKPNPDWRAAAYQELFRVYSEDALVLAQIYTHRVRDWHEEQVKLRNFASPISVRNLANDIPDPVADTLLEVNRSNVGIFQRWFRMKAGLLGMDKLRRYDIYAPLSSSEKEFDYGDAVEMVLETFGRFSPQVEAAARRVFDHGHIDAEIRPGKRGGAFCLSAFPGQTPYVLANWDGTAKDVATIAHELGHAVHAVLAENHSIFTFHSTLPLAETASVFSEMLVTDRLLAEEDDPTLRRNLIAEVIDDAYATVMRQAYFTIFERRAHEMIRANASADELHAAYFATLQEQFGDSLDLSEDFKHEWVAIPHIYEVPFYTYAYSFGQLLVYALYQRYQEQGGAFTPQYVKILTYGGAASPQHILSEAGIDMTSPDFWQGGYDFLSQLMDEIDAIETPA
ncbi:MAG: M3 family oligoendopeptidase [Anaerolineales bacterium]